MNKKLLVISFLLFLMYNSFASGNANISLTNATANGSWSFASSVYTFTPSANSSTINTADIQNCLLGSGSLGGSGLASAATNGAASVTIVTACSGTGTQSGNITMAQGITAATTSSTQFTFTITAAGSITIAWAINLTPASNAGTGYPGSNMNFSGATGVSVTAIITTDGGASSGTSTGGKAGDITLTSSGGTVSNTWNYYARGAAGGTGGGATAHGGAGGNITLSGTSVTIGNAAIDNSGGAAAGTANGGAGGSLSTTATTGSISTSNSITSVGGAGANGTPGNGGAGGTIIFTAATSISIGNNTLNTSGGAGSGNGNGGTGGSITLTASGGAITTLNTISANGGNSGSGTTNQSGGNGANITMTASTTISIGQGGTLSATGGTSRGTGTSTGGSVSLTGPSGITLTANVSMTATTTGGDLSINDGNSTVTSSGANDGQAVGYVISGRNLTKTGTGTFQLKGTNTYTGTTTLTTGVLQLGANNVLADVSTMNFNGGTLNAYYNETIGTITLSEYSVLNLGTGNHTFTAAASNGITWTWNKTLKVCDWLGGYNSTAAGGSDPKFVTGSSAELDASHLSKIYFYRASNATNYTAVQLASGEIVPSGTLPVELISFSVQKENKNANINWSTASEINSDYFEIFRSQDGINFESIGKISAEGTSNNIITYSFLDIAPLPGTSYYKLIEYDFDGRQQESSIQAIVFTNSSDFTTQLYPNPSSQFSAIYFGEESRDIYNISITDLNGKNIFSTSFSPFDDGNKFILPNEFSNGVYIINLHSKEGNFSSLRWIKK